MSQSKSEKPSVSTYADHEVLVPPNKLRRTLSTVSDKCDDPVARAEAALAALSNQFSDWMDSECQRLDSARLGVKAAGFTKATREALYHAAHDIKGQAATFGYPAAAAAAEILCRLIEHTSDMSRIPVALVDQHVDAVRAIIREHARPDGPAIAKEIIKRLREVTEEFLTIENRERPDLLEDIFGPPLVPGRPAR